MTELLPRVMNLPEHAPGLPAVVGALPVPFELLRLDVIPHHALLAFLPAHHGVADQSHLSLLECPCEIEVCAAAVDPGLAPETALKVVGGKAHSMQVGCDKIL